MRQVWVVVKREFLERVRSKGFILSTVAVPLLMIALMGFSAFMANQAEQSRRELVVVDFTGLLAERVAEGLEEAGFEVEIWPDAEGTEELDRRVTEDELEGYLILDDLTSEDGVVTYRGKESPRLVSSQLIRSIVVRTVLEIRLAFTEGGSEVEELLRGGELEFESVGGGDSDEDRLASILAGVLGSILLYFSLLVYGAYVLRSVLDEKRNRVVEVVISALRPWQLMLGKILGVGAVGMTQLGIWILFVVLVATLALPMLVAAWPVLEQASEISQALPGPGTLLLFLVFFVLGYFLYSALFAAVGAMCSSEEEAQQAQFPVMMLLIIPFVMQMSAIEGPGLPWLDWAALFPFFSPILMFPRAVSGDVPIWMVALSIVLLLGAIVATAWVAGRIYRVGILMQGKRPTLPELVRWVKEA